MTLTLVLAGCQDPGPPAKDPSPSARRQPLRNSDAPISDAAILAEVARPLTRDDQTRLMDRHEVIGTQNGVRVVIDYPCSDICPDYTTRVLHLDVAPGSACHAAGGVVREQWVPIGVAVESRPFCLPRILADRDAAER